MSCVAWAEPVSLGAGAQPRVVVNGERAFVFFGRPGEIMLSTSNDSGKTFDAPRAIAKLATMPLGMRRGPRAGAAGKTLVVTAIEGAQGGGKDGDVFAWVSKDDGKTWEKSKSPLNSVAGAAREGLHGMATSTGGLVAVAWLDLRNSTPGTPGTELWMSVSKDGGLTWEKDEVAYVNKGGTICQCCHPSVAIGSDNAIHVMFRNALDGNRDMYLITSKDNGKTFSEAKKLGNGTWPLNACPMDGGEVTVDAGGAVQTVWMRSGESFVSAPGEAENSIGTGKQPILAVTPKQTFFAFSAGKALMGQWSGAAAEKLADDGNFPSAAAIGDDAVLVAWQGKKDVMVARITPKP
jgi:hypothetical protein